VDQLSILRAFYERDTAKSVKARPILRSGPGPLYEGRPISASTPVVAQTREKGDARVVTQSLRADREFAVAWVGDPLRREFKPGLASTRPWPKRLVQRPTRRYGRHEFCLVLRPVLGGWAS